MSEWTTPTKTGKKQNTVTPDVTKGEPILQFTTGNPYDAFTIRSTASDKDSSKDSDKSSDDESSDSSIGSNDSDMPESTFASVAGLLKDANANMIPVAEPTKVDIVTLRIALVLTPRICGTSRYRPW